MRKRNLYLPDSDKPYRISRSKVDLFLNCRRCFYLDRRLGIGQPDSPPFSLNIAVDALLKKEFDSYRSLKKPHPLCVEFGIDAIPYFHADLDMWRDSLRRGIQHSVPNTNIVISGGVDDVWVNPSGELIVVDYKATSKNKEVTIDEEWQIAYKRQMEIYQWLFRRNNFNVCDTGYFVYCNGLTTADSFSSTLKFSIKVIPYKGKDDWIEHTIQELISCLRGSELPEASESCKYCAYRAAARQFE